MQAVQSYEQVILDHYRAQADVLGLGAASTMPDDVVRARELDAVLRYVDWYAAEHPVARVLEIGCGNGILLQALRERFPTPTLVGLDYTPEMVDLARGRAIPRSAVDHGDVRAMTYDDETFDVVVSERCIINLMDRDDQARALREVHRVLRPGGLAVLIEGFRDGLDNLNAARREMALEDIPMPHHNLFFEKDWFLGTVGRLFHFIRPADTGDAAMPDFNFLSSHYFMSRVVHAALSRSDQRNSHFVRFFSFVPPVGNYASVQLYVVRK